MPVRLFGIPPRLGRAGHPPWFCRGSGASLAASSPCRSAQLDRYRGRRQLRVPPDHRSGARWNAVDIPVGRCLIPSIWSARGVVLLKNGIDRSGVNRKRLRQEPVSLGIVALSLFMETLFGQSPGAQRYGLGIAGLHIVILHVVVHMDLPCRDNSRVGITAGRIGCCAIPSTKQRGTGALFWKRTKERLAREDKAPLPRDSLRRR